MVTSLRGMPRPTSDVPGPLSPEHFQRNMTVDLLRGLAILMVLVLHAVVMTPDIAAHPWLTIIANQLGAGVQMFFLLSGFVIAAAFERGLVRSEGTWGFLWRRAAKMLPLYFIFLHANIGFYLLANAAFEHPEFFRNSVSATNLTWLNYGLHLLLLQGLVPAFIHTLQDGSWSIVCEVYFYIAFPFLIHRFTRTPSQALMAFAGSLAFAVAFTMLLGRFEGAYGYYAFPAQLPCFLLGVYCHRLSIAWPDLELSGAHKIAFAVTIVFLFFGFAKAQTAPLGIHLLYTVMFALVLTLVPICSKSFLAEVLRSFGRQSYALFLLHLLLLKVVYTLIVTKNPQLGLPLVLALNLSVSVALSWLLSWTVFNRIDIWCVDRVSQRLQRRSASTQILQAN